MRGGEVHFLNFTLLIVLLLFLSLYIDYLSLNFAAFAALHESCCNPFDHLKTSVGMETKVDVFLREISPSASPQPFLPEISPSTGPQPLFPLLAPSPLTPFTNNTVPKLSGQCILNFAAVDTMMSVTSIDCIAVFATYLANVICCPQLEATLVVLIGQSSKDTSMLALNGTSAGHCLSDFEKILASQGASDTLQQICSIRPSNLTAGSCPVNDVNEFENTVDTSGLLAACEKIDLVNECCDQICQNAISEAVCPLAFPNMNSVRVGCGNGISNQTACCNVMETYVSLLQKQSFITNLQALNCAASLGKKLQKANITENIYNLCHIGLKDFSLQESGCLLPSLPSDVTLDRSSGPSFLCDLNDNIPALWPSATQISPSSCNKTVKIPALPAAASGQNVDLTLVLVMSRS
ncbi:hypothetical protein RHSIM_Rhsim13G0154500 [Rhododendron simsii]|uniref:SPARK domain-containing protein n=1 Tax=Rhododendron simsii TaxID=118357 RepID=A0A834FYA8_RHOSS|nr:hypothetical protein RHSIM_Rhsim13G0154500 [Rhododendron simsii]